VFTIRSIDLTELSAWAALDDRPDGYLGRQMASFVERGSTRPEWCFLAEDGGRAVGRVGIVAEPVATVDPSLEYRLIGLWLPWADDPLAVGRSLVDEAAGRVIPAGRHPLDFRINPGYQVHADIRRALAGSAGFDLFQEKEGFLWEAARPEPDRAPRRLVFRSLGEVGRELFAHTMGRGVAGTLDRADRHYEALVGPEAWGREMFEYLEPADEPSWKLALTPDGEPAGYILLSGFDEPDRATIVHIGVVPEQRGHGYVDDLFGEYNRMARERGFRTSISDVDVENGPMRAAMERNGHRSEATDWHVWHYRRIVDGG
jgi:RimJ/RimL family protein N-acetyltransferase